jgi:hypothetical protein
MTIRDSDLEPNLPASEREALTRMSARLESERPVPAASFRGDLRRRLVSAESRRVASRFGLAGTRRLAFGSLATGAMLLIAAAVGLADAGPLAPSDVSDAVASVISLL